MSVRSKLNKAVKDAVEKGSIDPIRQGAVIEAAKKLAKLMDSPDWPYIDGKFDNVSPSTFLKYCEKLGLDKAQPEFKSEAKLISMVGNSKWKKQA